MSRAVSAVLKVPSALPYFFAQASATRWVSAKASFCWAPVSGRGSAAASSSFRGSGRHSTGVDSPTPRGSKPTRSNRWRTSVGMVSARLIAASAPEAPGPPGLTSSEPIRFVCPASTTLTRNSGSVGPPVVR